MSTTATRVTPGDPLEIADDLAGHFLAVHGRDPDAVFAAPGRVNLIGEHTDYNGGLCMPIALPHATYVAAGARDDDVLTLASTQQEARFEMRLGDLRPGAVSGWAAYAAGVVWAAREAGIPVPGMDVVLAGTVPLGAGLSSSASLECAVALAACHLAGVVVDDDLRQRLVEVCGRAEREMAGAPTGGMDQTIALFAEHAHALLLDCRSGGMEQVPWDATLHGVALLVVDTRASHSLSDGGYGSRREQCEAAAATLGVTSLREADLAAVETLEDDVLRRRARHVVTEIARVTQAAHAMRADDFVGLGALFDASHASLRDDFEVSCAELDAVCEAAVGAGALGARMTGGGFGGSAIALVPVARTAAVEAAVARTFAARGWPAPGFLAGTASTRAHRVVPAE